MHEKLSRISNYGQRQLLNSDLKSLASALPFIKKPIIGINLHILIKYLRDNITKICLKIVFV
jgi:hypothetical protein